MNREREKKPFLNEHSHIEITFESEAIRFENDLDWNKLS